MLKKIFSAIAAAAIIMPTIVYASFNDVNEYSSEYETIAELEVLGIIEGDENGNFNPYDTVTRAEFTKMVIMALNEEQVAKSITTTHFKDCEGHWAAGYIETGVSDGFINGYSKEEFGPDDNVTYAQAVKLLVSTTGYAAYAEAAGGWPIGYITYGGALGITKGISDVAADTEINRKTAAALIDNAIKIPITVIVWDTPYRSGMLDGYHLEKQDGKEGRAYKTILTDRHNIYTVKGRVTDTSRSSGLRKGYVNYQVESSDNFDGKAYSRANTDTFQMKVGSSDMTSFLFIYSEALVYKDDMTDEYTILTIKAK